MGEGEQQRNLFEVMNGQPYLPLAIVNTAQITPGNCKRWLGLYGFHVTGLGDMQKRKETTEK